MTDRKKRAQFEQLFVPHLDAAYNFARWLMHHPQDAEDLVQEAYLKAYRSFDKYKGGDPMAWLFTIVRNTCYSWHTRQKKQGKVIDFSEALQRHDLSSSDSERLMSKNQPEAQFFSEETRQGVHQALCELPERYRLVLVLREFEELKYRQIAEILNVPVGTVMSRLSRARMQLKQRLGDIPDEEKQNEL